MTLAAELQTIRERAIRATPNGDDKHPGAYLADVFEMYDITRNTVPRLLDAVEKVLAELDHAAANGHHLDRDCQGVGPGERVPAARIENIEAAISTALEGK